MNYKERLAQATPPWVNLRELYYIFNEAARMRDQGIDAVVDHVVPLAGEDVCGLNIPANLCIVKAAANSFKGNRRVELTQIPFDPYPQLALF